jgi:hypothetical protein
MKRCLCLSLAFIVLAGCSDKSGSASSSTSTNSATATNSSGNPLNAPADYLRGLNKGQQNAIKTTDVASLNQAINLFNIDKGRNPHDLDELVKEKYIPQIPPAPYGMKLVYDSSSGKVSVVKQ